jgi:hypothetical protein
MKFPPITNPPKASITLPAADVPLCPFERISLVDARLRDNLNIVETSKIRGNEVNSTGASTNIEVIKTSDARVSDKAKDKSSIKGGIGNIRITNIITMPAARKISPLLPAFFIEELKPFRALVFKLSAIL